MRKKIINYLYHRKYLRWLLPLYHFFVGRNSVSGIGIKQKNELFYSNAHIYHDVFVCEGYNNVIRIAENTDFHNSMITIKGSENKIAIGADCFLNGVEMIVEGDRNSICIEENCFVLNDTRMYVVDGSSLTIKRGCMMSDQIDIRTTDNHSILNLVDGVRINYEKNVILHENVWIGTRVNILKGAEIATGCIVGAGSIVTGKHLVPNSIIAGNPAKEVKRDVRWLMERVK